MISPFSWSEKPLSALDFDRLELHFTKTIVYFLPCSAVQFMAIENCIDNDADQYDPAAGGTIPQTFFTGFNMVKKERQPIVDASGSLLFLPIWQQDRVIAVAVLSGGDSVQYGKYSLEWLLERSRLISREFRKIKQWTQDPETGLLQGNHLHANIDTLLTRKPGVNPDDGEGIGACWSVFLLEIYPRCRNAEQAVREISRAGACLDSLVGERVSLHHFGSGIFGFLWNSESIDEYRKLGYVLLRRLKRQSFPRAHISIVPFVEPGNAPGSTEKIIDQAWQGLQTARKRGPYAICIAPGRKEEHPLQDPAPEVLAALKRLWRSDKQFSIVCIEKDTPGKVQEGFSKRVCSLAGGLYPVLPENLSQAFIYLSGMDEKKAFSWLRKFKKKINELGPSTYSMGAASFPCASFTKSDVPVNARKALIHTSFYGPDTMTAFDGVSLNISGDIYYNEGDLGAAIKEYKLGLLLDPDNINLMNSLAVIYAQVNRYSKAIPLFEKVLELDCKDFMALFNIGFAHLRKNNIASAVGYFEEALHIDDSYFDLLLQLGQLYCQLGRYQEGVTILVKAEQAVTTLQASQGIKPWDESEENTGQGKEIGHGLVYRYLGEAYMGAGMNREAMTYLQRATRYNSRDAAALSMLGSLYLAEKQGDEIALSLCQQAVSLDESKWMYWFRLAEIFLKQKEYAKALEALKHCLALNRKNGDVMYMTAQTYERLKQKNKARTMYERVLRVEGGSVKKAKRALRRM